jgi:CheY-like chemotaxis protein
MSTDQAAEQSARQLEGWVLVVDDDELVAALVVKMLARAGVEGRIAGQSERAEAACARAPQPSVVVLDHGVQDSDRVLATARKAGIPVVLISGDTRARDDAAFADVPPERFLAKPFTSEQLVRAIARAPAV